MIEYSLLEDKTDARFQLAFKQYFEEIEIQISDWDDLFRQMSQEEGNLTFLIENEDKDAVIGFLEFRFDRLNNWFFEEKVGFIREFWIHPDRRGQNLGTGLLRHTELYLQQNQVHKVILTSDTAEAFYQKNRYQIDRSYMAKNDLPVYSKVLP